MTEEELARFSKAWSDKDIDTLMSFMTDRSVYAASVGPEPGATYTGLKEIRDGFSQMLKHDTGRRKEGLARIFGETGLSEWSFTENIDGRDVEVRGCDIFLFRGNKILKKDAFRKVIY